MTTAERIKLEQEKLDYIYNNNVDEMLHYHGFPINEFNNQQLQTIIWVLYRRLKT